MKQSPGAPRGRQKGRFGYLRLDSGGLRPRVAAFDPQYIGSIPVVPTHTHRSNLIQARTRPEGLFSLLPFCVAVLKRKLAVGFAESAPLKTSLCAEDPACLSPRVAWLDRVKTSGLACVALTLAGALGVGCGGGVPPRGVVLVVIDTLRADAPDLAMSEFQRLAEESIYFPRTVAHAPWTLPTTASILTGVYPPQHGAGGNWAGDFSAISPHVPTLAERLRGHGFRTHAVANGAFVSPEFGLERGFEGYDFEPGANAQIRRALLTMRRGIGWLKTVGDAESFFLYLHLFDPHLNYAPIPEVRGRFTSSYRGSLKSPYSDITGGRDEPLTEEDREFVRGLYLEEVGAADAALGVLVDWLRAAGLLDETVLVVTADHGEEFWEHGRFEHGHSFYEELIRVPLLIRPPGGRRGGEARPMTPAQQVDVVPTVLHALGMQIPVDLDGQILISGGSANVPSDPRPAPSFNLLYAGTRQGQAVQMGEWKLVQWLDGFPELYNLTDDPRESINLAGADPERVTRLGGELERLSRADLGGGVSVELDSEHKARLRALGYLD